jgi:hypothetical protein
MKNLLLTLILVLSVLSGVKSQVITHKDWTIENEGQWNSFYWGVTKTQYPDVYGNYYYYIYFFSNSFFNTKVNDGVNYDKASTYIRGINVIMYENTNSINNKVVVNIPYLTCDWGHDPNYYGAWFYSSETDNNFTITFTKASAYDYSIY